MPRGVLLYGPPGTGKTLLAKAVAHESGAVFYSQSAASFVEMFVGVGAARIRRLFKSARKHAPAIVFIDELDAVGGHRGSDIGTSERDQTLNQLLVEMDGFSSTARRRRDRRLQPAREARPGAAAPGPLRPPDLRLPARRRRPRAHPARPLAQQAGRRDVDFALLARQTAGLTGADLANICNEAAIFAGRRGGDRVEAVDFDTALERVVAGHAVPPRGLPMHERRVVAYHEAGHAVCGELLPSVDPVHRISIIPRGRALGYTLNLPEEDRYLKTREELIDMMTMLLGGRAAEALVIGSITNGAADDLSRVTGIANSMVHEWAMGTGITSMRVDEGSTSDSLRRVIDDEVRELADEAMRSAVELLAAHRPQLDQLANQLLSEESLERDDIDRVMSGVPQARPARRPQSHLGIAAADPGDDPATHR